MLQSVLDKVLNFKDFSRANKDIKYYSRTLTEFKDFSRQLTTKNSRSFQDRANHGFTKMHRQIALIYV